MRTKSREYRKGDAFDSKFDVLLLPVLWEQSFIEVYPYLFIRDEKHGKDLVYFDVEERSFIVHVSYKPNYMHEIDDLYQHYEKESLGAFSYLTPGRMIHKPKEYQCNTTKKRDHSFNIVKKGLSDVAFQWLVSLRDPVKYVETVSQDALIQRVNPHL